MNIIIKLKAKLLKARRVENLYFLINILSLKRLFLNSLLNRISLIYLIFSEEIIILI